MPAYYLYLMNPARRIQRRLEVRCASDEQALREASSISHGQDVEVWLLDRFVGTVRPGA